MVLACGSNWARPRGEDGGLRMRDLFLRTFSDSDSSADSPSKESWLTRVRDNLGQLLIPTRLKHSSANGAPIHLLRFEKTRRPARAQGVSLITHAVLFAAVVLILTKGPAIVTHPKPGGGTDVEPITLTMPILRSFTNEHPSDPGGRSGDKSLLLPTRGNFPPRAPVVVVRPMLRQEEHPSLPEPPTILDPNATSALTPTEKMGLPWMSKDTNAAGPGAGHGIGTENGDTMGTGGEGPGGAGVGVGPYVPGFVQPVCVYCPSPTYTDDARHGKVQGTVTLQVLVDTDGRARQIRVIKGVGFGLDERAVETVRSWKFSPARDGAHRTLATWVTIEAVFRLF